MELRILVNVSNIMPLPLFFVLLLFLNSEGLLLQNVQTFSTKGHPNVPVDHTAGILFPRDCQDYLWQGYNTSGIYAIYPQRSGRLEVYCDQQTDGGGWNVFQRRMDGTVDFFRNWTDYMYGFGNKSREFWLGNHFIFEIVSQGFYELRVDLEDFAGEKRYAVYRRFSIGGESKGFNLLVENYIGTAGDSMSRHNGAQFYTKDHDTNSCASTFKGAWWYTQCHNSNLNGLYLRGAHSSYADGIEWKAWHGLYYSLKFTEMKFRRF